MSVLIKGMEMPKKGVYLAVITFDGDSIGVRIPPSKEPFFSGKIVHIPTPHGRLIDCERATFPTAFRYNTNDYAQGWNACIKAVQTAPTIIEAEVSE